jgi:hypothetical protein
MFDTKSPVMKAARYGIITFFALIIIISFGMPDFISRLGMDNSIIAVVNGQKINRIDYLRYRDNRFGHIKAENMEDLILNYYIGDVLLLQEAYKTGLAVSDDRIADLIRNDIPAFKDPQTGKFDPDRYQRIREANHLTGTGFYEMLRKDILKDDYISLLKAGISVSPDDISTEYMGQNSSAQIQYTYISDIDLKKRWKNEITVTDDEINAEISKNKKEIKDPRSDRPRISKKLENEKFNRLKKGLIDSLNALALKKGSFAEAAAMMQGVSGRSEVFKIGDEIKEQGNKEKNLAVITNSPVFLEECAVIEKGKASRVIESSAGLYVFSTVRFDLPKTALSPEDSKKLAARISGETYNMVTSNVMKNLHEKSKIVKNLNREKN